jgi:YhgE/Pip-like protein
MAHPAHLAPAGVQRKLLSHPSAWAVPTVVVMLICAIMSMLYLGGSVNPNLHIKGFPVAVVNQDAGTTLPDGTAVDVGESTAQAITSGVDAEQFDVRSLTLEKAQEQMGRGELYGAIVLPADLSSDLIAYAGAAARGETASQPVVEVLTNPRIGAAATATVTRLGESAFSTAETQIGQQLQALVQQTGAAQAAATGSRPAQLSGLAAAALEAPLDVQVNAYQPLPDGTGGGISAFYYVLLLVLAGFTGSMTAGTLIDSRLGFTPTEVGPRFMLLPHSGISRRATLIFKWVVMALIALGVSGLYLAVSQVLDMPVDHPVLLWAFGAAAIFSVATLAQAIQATVGSLGMIVNLFIFIILAMPSAGATIPLEMLPDFFRWLATFEPMHQLYLGTRSILYFDATAESGLIQGFIATAVFTAIGLLVGLAATTFYDRKGLQRRAADPVTASEPGIPR